MAAFHSHTMSHFLCCSRGTTSRLSAALKLSPTPKLGPTPRTCPFTVGSPSFLPARRDTKRRYSPGTPMWPRSRRPYIVSATSGRGPCNRGARSTTLCQFVVRPALLSNRRLRLPPLVLRRSSDDYCAMCGGVCVRPRSDGGTTCWHVLWSSHIAEYGSTGYGCQSCSWSAEQGNEYSPVRACLRIWYRKTGSAVPFRVSLLISILRLNLVLTYGIPPEFRGGVHLFI